MRSLPRAVPFCLAFAMAAPCFGAVAGRTVALAPAMSLAQAAPAFRQSMISQIGLVTSLSAQPQPSLSALLSAAPTPADPWRGESARLIGALAADPAALAARQAELRAALGDHHVDVLLKASSRLRGNAAADEALASELGRLREGLDLTDAASMDALGSRLNALFEASRTRIEASAVAAGDGSKKPLVSLSKPGEKPAMSAGEFESYVAENSVTSPRGLRRVNFASGDYRREYDAVLRRLGVDMAVIKTPSRAELASFKEEDGYHLKSEYERWVLPARSLEEHVAALGEAKRQKTFRRELAASAHVPVEMGPLTVEQYERWYPIYEEEVVGKPGGKRNVALDYARQLQEKGDLPNWYGLFYFDPADRTKVIGGSVFRASRERGMFIGGYAAYRPELKDARPGARSFAEGITKAHELGFKVFSFGQDTNFFGYDYSLGLMANKSGFNPTPYPEDEIVLMKVLQTGKIASVRDKLGRNGGYFFFGIRRSSPLVDRYLASREAGAPQEAQELLGGGYFTPEILPAGETTVARRFKGDDPSPLRTPPGIEVVEEPMAVP